jgi:predicted nucleotidyltransferase component of viral defense system
MLHQNAVPPPALALLKTISTFEQLNSFGLGGGTNIALRLGHRLSVDLDFFTNAEFDTQPLFHLIVKKLPSSELLYEKNQTMMFSINDIKVDFVLYPFPWLKPFDISDNIRFLSFEDIIPMKLQAVSNRNLKRDYWDIASLLNKYALDKMMNFFRKKFPQIDIGYIIHNLTDFEKADTEPDPDILDNKTWEDVKHQLTSAVNKYTLDLL